MTKYCDDFECVHMRKCINADNHCYYFQDCPRIRTLGKCSLCFFKSVCIGKEKFQDGKND